MVLAYAVKGVGSISPLQTKNKNLNILWCNIRHGGTLVGSACLILVFINATIFLDNETF